MAKKRRRHRRPTPTSMLAHTVPKTYRQPHGEIDRTRSWYAAVARVRRSKAARQRLADLGCTPYRPVVYEQRRSEHGRLYEIAADALPRYVLLTKPDGLTFDAIRGLPEIASLVQVGDAPAVVAPQHIQRMIDLFSGPAAVRDGGLLSVGEVVRIVEGPFASYNATVVACDEHGQVRAEVALFGRSTPVTLQPAYVERR